MTEPTDKKTTKVQAVVAQVLTEYKNVPVSCAKCGDKIRTDSDNNIYCPNGSDDCPLMTSF